MPEGMDQGQPIGQQAPQQPGEDMAFMTPTRWLLLGIAVVLIAGFFFFFGAQDAGQANVDYSIICTKNVDVDSTCANGSWGDWQQVSSNEDTNTCTATTIERRVYTGTRDASHTLQYNAAGNGNCPAGYQQTGRGSRGDIGSSVVVSQSTACQIEEDRTTRTPITTGEQCQNNPDAGDGATIDVTSQTTDTGQMSTSQSELSSLNELQTFNEALIDADISANPTLVREGDTTVVTWSSVETTECTVDGTNGDQWTGISGEETSSGLPGQTTFTLTCQAFNGDIVTDEVTVGVAPQFEEI